MLKTLLVPHDGSDLADRVLPYVAGLARRAGGRVVLVRATAPGGFPTFPSEEAHRAAIRLDQEGLDAVAEKLRDDGLAVEAHVEADDPARAILAAAERHGADLIALSTHGRSGLGRWVYGSVADRVLRHADVPVLLIPPDRGGGWTAATGEATCRILVPLDGSDLGRAALGPAVELARVFDADIVLVQAVEPVPLVQGGVHGIYVTPDDLDREQSAAARYLVGVAEELRSTGVRVRTRAEIGSPIRVIAALAGEEEVLAIALATHGRGGLERFFLGSVSTGLVARSGVPLLLVRPIEARRPAAEPVAATPAEPEPVGRPVTITLSPSDLKLVRVSLEEMLLISRREQHQAAPLHELLAHLRAAEAEARLAAPAGP